MKSPLIQLCIFLITIFPFAFGEVDPFAEPREEKVPSEADARVVTNKGHMTLEILRTVKIDSVKIVTGRFEEGYQIIRDRLAKHGIEVRIMKGRKLDPKGLLHVEAMRVPEVGYFLKLENVTIEKFMKTLDQWAMSGWILYPDGSITYFENQCACSWPKDGIYCHDSQYEAGKPEVMKAASVKQQAGSGQPDTRSESNRRVTRNLNPKRMGVPGSR